MQKAQTIQTLNRDNLTFLLEVGRKASGGDRARAGEIARAMVLGEAVEVLVEGQRTVIGREAESSLALALTLFASIGEDLPAALKCLEEGGEADASKTTPSGRV